MNATRRSVVATLLAAAGVTVGRRAFGANLLGAAPPAPVLRGGTLAPQANQPLLQVPLRTRIIRPKDFLYLDIEYDNIVPVGDPVTDLERGGGSGPAVIIVHHQPQAIADQAYLNVDPPPAGEVLPDRTTGEGAYDPKDGMGLDATPVPPQVAGARLAGESRLAFVMPAGTDTIPYTLPSLLAAFRTWEMNLDFQAGPVAKAAGSSVIDLSTMNGLLAHFAEVKASLNAGVSPEQQAELGAVLDNTFATVRNTVQAQVSQHRPLTGAQVDGLIQQELQRNLQSAASAAAPPPAPNVPGGTNRFTFGQLRTFPQTDDTTTVPLVTLQPLTTIDWAKLIALMPLLTKPHPPAAAVTAIELPYRLIQSPLATAGWIHADLPQTHGDLTEIWHTRLGTRGSGGVTDDRSEEPLRAIWSPDYPLTDFSDPPKPFRMSLDGSDRKMLVKLTAGYDETTATRTQYVPTPAIEKRLMLTSLGGWLLEDGEWPFGTGPSGVDIVQWNHRAAMARDYYVRVVYAGFLFPFGHAASLVKITERKFEYQGDGGGRIAILRQRFYIVVRQKTRNFPGVSQPYDGRDFPFTRVDLLTTTTPDLGVPGGGDDERINQPGVGNTADPAFYHGDPNRMGFWPVVPPNAALPGQGKDFLFQALGYDHAGAAIPFTTPLFFLSATRNNNADVAKIIDHYKLVANQARRTRPFNGVVIQVAPNTGADPGDTNMPTNSITFVGAPPDPPGVTGPDGQVDPYIAQFYPAAEQSEVKLPAVQKLLGSDQPVITKVSDVYKQQGFDPGNAGQVFLDLLNAAAPIVPGVPTDKGGGFVSPNMVPTALSRTLGSISGANHAAALIAGGLKNGFKPTDFLGPDLKLFGVVPLGEILADLLPLKDAPKLVNIELPNQLVTTFSIHQEKLSLWPKGDPDKALFIPDADAASVFDITSTITVTRNGTDIGTPQSKIHGTLNDFKINLFGCITLTFDTLTFDAVPGKKPDVTIGLNPDHGVLFGGPLEFVNKLKDLIPANGFSDPPALSVTPGGVSASFSLAIPTITLGVLTLANINIGAGFSLPFDGRPPSATFNFAEQHNPFNLTVSLFGGGGFLAIKVSAKGVETLEAQLEFGAFAALDIGVASGSVYVKGGFHFVYQESTQSISLEAFVELGGHLSVLGLISVTLTFHVGLTYVSSPGKSELVGQATLTVEVEVLFFSKSVSMTVEKRFAGSAADPKFIDFIPTADIWQEYCTAFG